MDKKNDGTYTLTSKNDNKKLAWIKSCVTKYNQSNASIDTSRLTQIPGSIFCCYETIEPMVTGLGLSHPVENGFLWHHTFGVPYLPGSSVKGLVRAWASQWAENVKPEDFKRIFGSTDKEPDNNNDSNKNKAGSVIFFDALPTREITLKADIMTPHYSEYYTSEGGTAPSDDKQPTPIPFLVIDSGAKFQFAFKARKGADDGDIGTVQGWLEQALEHLGAGAKTAVGYGRMKTIFSEKEQAEAKRIQEQEEKNKKIQEYERKAQKIEEEKFKKNQEAERKAREAEEIRLKNRSRAEVLIEDTFGKKINRQALEQLQNNESLYINFSDEEKRQLIEKIKCSHYFIEELKTKKGKLLRKEWQNSIKLFEWDN